MSTLDWHWTNDERTEARAGRWSVRYWADMTRGHSWALHHDDFAGGEHPIWNSGNPYDDTLTGQVGGTRWSALGECHDTAQSFLAWLASQPVTLEHREGEYVHVRMDARPDLLYQFAEGTWYLISAYGESQHVRSRDWMEDVVSEGGLVSHGFLTPGTITKAQPAEPTTFGYVGTVVAENGDEWDVERYKGASGLNRTCVTRRSDGENDTRSWANVLALGTFEGVTP